MVRSCRLDYGLSGRESTEIQAVVFETGQLGDFLGNKRDLVVGEVELR